MITYPTISPSFLKIGSIEFRWYGLMYAISFVLGYFLLLFLIRKNKRFKTIGMTGDLLIDLIFFVLVGVMIGGRLGYILFYNFSYYIQHLWEVFAVWEGGMSFHGGLIGVVIAGLLFCKIKRINIYDIADLLVLAVPLGLGLGRLGNFINGELYGRITTVPWCMQFPLAVGCRHPSQLYEFFFEGVLLWVILWILKDKRMPKGALFWLFFLLYGVFRFVLEYFREPDVQIGYIFSVLTMGQLLSIPLILLGLFGLVAVYKHSSK